MSILIKDLDMPQGDEMLCINIYPDGKVCIDMDLKCKQVATAVPIPPHGRLIDADALEYTMLYKENWMRGTGVEALAVWKSDTDAAPTIIEAEENE